MDPWTTAPDGITPMNGGGITPLDDFFDDPIHQA